MVETRIDVTPDEWKEWRSMPQTKEMIGRLYGLRQSKMDGYVNQPREKWRALLDECTGIAEAIHLAENLHKEAASGGG